MKSIFTTLIVGMALLMVGCASKTPQQLAFEQKCDAAGGYAWSGKCRINGYKTYPYRGEYEAEKLACVRAGGNPIKSNASELRIEPCPLDNAVTCHVSVPKATCNSIFNS